MRTGLVILSILALVGCKDQFDDYQANPIAGTWTLLSVEGIPGCTVTSGELQFFDIEGMPIRGDFNWSASCGDGDGISEAGDVQAVETDKWGEDYGVDILLHTPSAQALDWDCAMSEPELTCIESGDAVVVFEFTRQGE